MGSDSWCRRCAARASNAHVAPIIQLAGLPERFQRFQNLLDSLNAAVGDAAKHFGDVFGTRTRR
jgi:hypothetical protein